MVHIRALTTTSTQQSRMLLLHKRDLPIPTPGGVLAATVYSKDEALARPTIILSHGFCGIRQVLVPSFAEFFAARGFHALTFDYRGFGGSEGERGRLVPAMQIEDIDQVVRWAARQPFVLPEGLGLWGTSLGGAHVIEVAARNAFVQCVVSQLAFGDGMSLITEKMSEEARASFIETLDKMHERKLANGKETMVSINRVLSDPDSKAFFEDVRVRHPEIDIRIPFLTVREMLSYSPANAASEVRQPTLIVAAEEDIVNPPGQAELLYKALAGPKDWHLQPGARHYDLYSHPHFEPVAERQYRWFADHLGG